MAQRYNTGNPRSSNSMKDVNDNAIAYDEYINGEGDEAYDRFGKPFPTVRRAVADRINEITGASRDAEEYAKDAKVSADNAQNIADANTYYTMPEDPDGTIAGLAGTPDGKSFRVAIQDATLSVVAFNYYLNKGGMAEFITSYPNKRYLDMVKTLAVSTDNRTDGIQSASNEQYPYEMVDKNGKGVHMIDDVGANIFPGGLKTPNVITQPDEGDEYLYAEVDRTGRVLFATDTATGKKIYLGEPLHNHRGLLSGDFFAIGDSITANGISAFLTVNGDTYAACFNALSWHSWAMLLTLGRLKLTGASATGGYTVSQILSIHMPNAVAARSTFCVVMGGRNDIVQGIDIDEVTIPAFKKIFRILRQKGIIPVVCTMSAQGNSSNDTRRSAEHKLNGWLRAYARKYRLPLVDLHRYTVDPLTGDWISGYNQDVSHPNAIGAKAMAKALIEGLLEWTAPVWPTRADEQVSAALTSNLLDNPLFLDNDGVNPTGWTIDKAGTSSIQQDDAVKGNVWRFSGQKAYRSISVIPGTKLAIGYFVKTEGSLFECFAVAGTNSSTDYLAGIRGWDTKAVTDGFNYFYYEFLVPQNKEVITIIVNSGTATASIAQLGLFHITEL
ncbi:SGNH/GDSL hydrolase family protein [Serratia liquefaciens]|uniref:SGNH/GDSL hydrolase family protein n=1 Tax=Serratia liquefaciens TaxID=614 RepID=UPI001F3C1989|nr:SGNH/GDSL hydrolase family protein [Serratia liquefaciens]MCE9941347.1 SGNH/GDSL hydrolase family protein [Serratia liquefaciens]